MQVDCVGIVYDVMSHRNKYHYSRGVKGKEKLEMSIEESKKSIGM
jgi:hypothetical protein